MTAPSSAPVVVSWFSTVPAVVWSGVIGALAGAFVSFLTSWQSNRASLRRLREQHKRDDRQAAAQREHDANQKNEDRKSAIRREIYGQAVEDIHALLAAIGGLADRPVGAEGDTNALQAFLKSNAKVWLVADAPAARLSRNLASTMSEYFMAALTSSVPTRQAMEVVRQFDRRIAHGEEDLRAVDVEARTAVADRDDDKLKALTASSQWISSALADLRRNRDAAFMSTLPLRKAWFEGNFEQLMAAQQLMVRQVSALRAELHLEADEAEFLRLLEDMKQRAHAAVGRAFDFAGGDQAEPGTIRA